MQQLVRAFGLDCRCISMPLAADCLTELLQLLVQGPRANLLIRRSAVMGCACACRDHLARAHDMAFGEGAPPFDCSQCWVGNYEPRPGTSDDTLFDLFLKCAATRRACAAPAHRGGLTRIGRTYTLHNSYLGSRRHTAPAVTNLRARAAPPCSTVEQGHLSMRSAVRVRVYPSRSKSPQARHYAAHDSALHRLYYNSPALPT